MPDTTRGYFKGTRCSDCGTSGCTFKHWGPLVPAGTIGYFCDHCMLERKEDGEKGIPPKPIGWKIVGLYTKAAFDGLKEKTEVWEEKSFLPPEEAFLSYTRGGSWWINESFLVRGKGGIYLVYHGYKPAVYTRYFAVWLDGPFFESRAMDVLKEISQGGSDSAALFIEADEKITVNIESCDGSLGRKFRGLIDGGTIPGTRVEQVRTAAGMLI